MIYVVMLAVRICLLFVVGAVMVRSTRKYKFFFFSCRFDQVSDCGTDLYVSISSTRYCMRVMLEKVPEGDWFCEECELNEELERRQEHLKLLGTIERSRSLGRTTSVNSEFSPKLENKDSFCERSKLKTFSVKKQLPSKRTEDSFEAGPTAKKQALESSTGSPTALSPSRVLSKDSSFRNLDKTKGKSINQLSMGIEAAVDASENPRSPTRNSPQSLKGSSSCVACWKSLVNYKSFI